MPLVLSFMLPHSRAVTQAGRSTPHNPESPVAFVHQCRVKARDRRRRNSLRKYRVQEVGHLSALL